MDRYLHKRICTSLDLMIGIVVVEMVVEGEAAEGMTGPVVLISVELAAVAGVEIVKVVGALGEVVAVAVAEGIESFCTT